MKLCNSPANTRCVYQRIARDQAPDQPDANNAQAGAASQAFNDLYQHLEGNNDDEALGLLKHLMNCMTDGGRVRDGPAATLRTPSDCVGVGCGSAPQCGSLGAGPSTAVPV